MKMLSKYVSKNPEDWDEGLKRCLWAYRIVYKVSTHYTPFDLVYGKEAVLPIQVQLDAFKI